jgi:hypothetical protein
MGPAVGLGNPQVRHELGNDLGFHAGTPVRVDYQLPGRYILADAALLDETSRKGIVFG